MDTAIIASLATSLLSPFLAQLLKGGETAIEEVGKKLGSGALERAKGVWAKLSPKVAAEPAVLKAAENVAKAPADEKAQNDFSAQLKALLDTDDALARQIASITLYERIDHSQVFRDSTVTITGDANIIGQNNYSRVTKARDVSGDATLEGFSKLLRHLREDLLDARVDDKTRKVVFADIQVVESEAQDPRPSLSIIETRLKGIQSMVKRLECANSPTIMLGLTIQKAIEFAGRLFS
jgi:hypothetical protein